MYARVALLMDHPSPHMVGLLKLWRFAKRSQCESSTSGQAREKGPGEIRLAIFRSK